MTNQTQSVSYFDFILVGGGLQNALILLALADRQPTARVVMLEQDARLGGNHVWSFQALDLPQAAWAWAEPLAEYHWPGYQLYFANSTRWVEGRYHSLTSEHLERIVKRVAEVSEAITVRTETTVDKVDEHTVTLRSREVLHGAVVVDARGPQPQARVGGGGYQKFVGLECELERPTTIEYPVLMDTRCPQEDGFRFLYILPFSAVHILIEDTYFSNHPNLDTERLEKRLLADAQERGLLIKQVLRKEVGVLPMASTLSLLPRRRSPIQGGIGGGWFNPGTGYSLPAAARLAEHLANSSAQNVFSPAWSKLVRRLTWQSRFLTFLNLLMFSFFHDEKRSELMERFYRLPGPVVHRFFAMESTLIDQWRIMWVGAPWTPRLLASVTMRQPDKSKL